MIGRMLIASVVVFALCGLWLLAVQAGRRMAARHPELGCYREEGGGCGKGCRCSESAWGGGDGRLESGDGEVSMQETENV